MTATLWTRQCSQMCESLPEVLTISISTVDRFGDKLCLATPQEWTKPLSSYRGSFCLLKGLAVVSHLRKSQLPFFPLWRRDKLKRSMCTHRPKTKFTTDDGGYQFTVMSKWVLPNSPWKFVLCPLDNMSFILMRSFEWEKSLLVIFKTWHTFGQDSSAVRRQKCLEWQGL